MIQQIKIYIITHNREIFKVNKVRSSEHDRTVMNTKKEQLINQQNENLTKAFNFLDGIGTNHQKNLDIMPKDFADSIANESLKDVQKINPDKFKEILDKFNKDSENLKNDFTKINQDIEPSKDFFKNLTSRF